MSDFVSPKKKKDKDNTMVNFLRKQKLAVINTPEKVMRQIYIKTASVAVKVAPTTKSSAAKTPSVVKVVAPATYGTDKEVYPYKSPFEVGSMVSINGRDLDGYRFRNRDTPTTFYGIGEENTFMDAIGWGDSKF